VLPPIPTAGLTGEDVHDLADRVREQMLQTLHEISGKKPSRPQDTSPAAGSKTLDPPITSSVMISEDSQSGSDVPGAPERSENVGESVGSIRKKDGSENGTETEEDEGMVLVGRPV
jgi:lysophosphatidate acyltransferase